MKGQVENLGSTPTRPKGRVAVSVGVMVAIALIHAFRIGSYLTGSWYILYSSFVGDITIPFGMYFLLCINDFDYKFLRDWRVKGLLVFGFSSATEIGQYFGIHMLGVTFDPLDFVMFGIGTLLAAFADKMFMSRVFRFWELRL
jgi:hypothetical protein